MKQPEKFNHFTVAVLIAAAIVSILYSLTFTNFYRGVQYACTDFKWRHFYSTMGDHQDTIIVAIDETSIKSFSKDFNINWPWPRQFYGKVVDYLGSSGAKTVIFDMLFNEPESGRIDVPGGTSDQDFSNAVKNYGKAIIGAMLDNTDSAISDSAISKMSLSFDNSELLPLTSYSSATFPIPELLNSTKRTGLTNFHNDSDGICRRLPLVFKIAGKFYPQLAFAAYLEIENDTVIKYDPETNALVTKKKSFKLDKNGLYPIYWYGPGGENKVFRYDTFRDVLISSIQHESGEKPLIPSEEYNGKRIVVCATAAGLLDYKPTPFTAEAPYPGGEIHATLLENLLNSHTLYEIGIGSVSIFTLILVTFLGFIFIRCPLFISLGTSVLSLLLTLLTSFYLFYRYSTEMDFMFPTLAIILVSAGTSMYKMLTEGEAKRQIKTIFSRYLSEDVINILMEEPEKVDLEGAEISGTVLFTDLESFTTFSEDKTPRELIDILNKYFEVITSIVLQNGGLLDKYTGDGIMTIFGAPIENEVHAMSACECILAFREMGVNEIMMSDKGPIRTRVGIATGPMIVGNLGSRQRMDYTAIGDTVNLAARLEGVNKAYGTTNIMGESTWEQVKDSYCFRELDFIRVKGKNRPIRIFTLIDRIDNLTDTARKVEDLFKSAFDIYRQNDWESAIKAFERVLNVSPEDAPARAYIERCRLLLKKPELVDEDGVFTFQTK